MLGDDDLGQSAQVFARLVIAVDVVILRTVDETNHIGILLNRTGLAQVAQLRRFTLYALTRFDTTVQLRERDNRDVQLFCQTF